MNHDQAKSEAQAALNLGINNEALQIIRGVLGTPLEPLTLLLDIYEDQIDLENFRGNVEPNEAASDEEGEAVRLSLDTLAAMVPEAEADELVLQLQPLLKPFGIQVLTTEQSYEDIFPLRDPEEEPHEDDEEHDHHHDEDEEAVLVFFRAEEPDSLLMVRGTNGVNAEVGTNDVLQQLAEWSEKCEFAVVGASFDWVGLHFNRLPDDIEGFADEVYEFCPDVLDQGIIKPLPEELADKSPDAMSEAEIAQLEEILESQTIADLADFLLREKRLWLWWE